MLGHRGCRLGITFPEITIMQARAIFEAVAESPHHVAFPEIMVFFLVNKKNKKKVPLVGFDTELQD